MAVQQMDRQTTGDHLRRKVKSSYVKLPDSLIERLSRYCERTGHSLQDWCLYAIDDRLDFETSTGSYVQGDQDYSIGARS